MADLTVYLQKFKQFKVIPVVALEQAQQAITLGKILTEEGLPVIEITFRSAAAVEAIRILRAENPEITIVAGTVLTAAQVDQAQQAGADLIVSPGFNPNTVKACRERNIGIIPGVNNPMAIEAALEMDIQVMKFFPAEASGGVPMLKSLLAPYRMIQFMPTGGISPQNLANYLAVPGVINCGMSWMAEAAMIQAGDWETIRSRVRQVASM